MSIELTYSDRFAPQMGIWKFSLGGAQFLHLEIDEEKRSYGITWYTTVRTQKGLDAIRQSYARLKSAYRETHELERIKKILNGSLMVGPVTFELRGHDAPSNDSHISIFGRTMAVEMPYFLNSSSFGGSADGQNPLLWIRVNTEYLAYHFEGEATPLSDEPDGSAMDPPKIPARTFGMQGEHNATGEIVTLFSETSITNLSDEGLTGVRQRLENLLGRLPTFSKR